MDTSMASNAAKALAPVAIPITNLEDYPISSNQAFLIS
jgi:hypothetical protein